MVASPGNKLLNRKCIQVQRKKSDLKLHIHHIIQWLPASVFLIKIVNIQKSWKDDQWTSLYPPQSWLIFHNSWLIFYMLTCKCAADIMTFQTWKLLHASPKNKGNILYTSMPLSLLGKLNIWHYLTPIPSSSFPKYTPKCLLQFEFFGLWSQLRITLCLWLFRALI